MVVSTASAENCLTNEDLVTIDSDECLQIDTVDNLSQHNQEISNELENSDSGSFDEFQELIYNSGSTIELTKDYKRTDDDTVSLDGIKVNKRVTIDGKGHTIDASNLGRIFYLDRYAIVLKNIKFINANSDDNGGAIYGANLDLTFDNCTFINNTAKNGGAIYAEDSCRPRINNSYFENNTADVSGGAIVSNLQGFEVYNSNFVNNRANYKPEEYSSFARYGGGAIYSKFWATQSVIDNSNFTGNTANYLGGAVNVQSGANSRDLTIITNSRFENNSAASSGAVFLGTRFSEINGSTFINNHANETGGAVGVYHYFNTISNSYFENNSAERDGGAVFSFSPYYHTNTIDNSTFVNNSAGTYGGAVNAISTDITSSTFIDNTAGDYGGAVTAYGSDVNGSTFTNNNAPDGTVLVMNDGSDINRASSSQNNNGLDDDEVTTDYTDRGILSPMSGYPPNVIWSDLGYVGFCCEKFYSQPYSGLVDHTLNVIDNNINGKPVGEYLKILLFTYFDGYNDFFKYSFPDLIWEFTDYDYENSDNEVIQNVIRLYDSGYRVPTENALKVINGKITRMDFLALDTADGEQDIFLFNWDTLDGDINKESLNQTTFIGEKIDFKITVKNTGDALLSNITVEDTDFSKELIYLGYKVQSGNWTYDANEKVWKVDPLKSGESAVIILTFKSTTNGTFYNNATLKTKDMQLSQTSAPTNVYTPQLYTKKISINKTVYNGQIAEFVISVNNTGDYPLNNVFVEDIADEDLIYLDYINGSREWKYKDGKFNLVGTLAPNEVANLTVLFKTTKSGNFTNTATGGSDETENHTWDDSVEVFSPEFSVQKITLNKTVYTGDIVEFKIVVTNTGDCELSNIVIKEEAQEGLKYINYKSDLEELSYDNGEFKYKGNLAIGESIEFIVQFEATKKGNLTNTIKVSSDEGKTENASNITNVIEKEDEGNQTDDNSTDDEEDNSTDENTYDSDASDTHYDGESEIDSSEFQNEGSGESSVKSINVDANATGNPFLALLMVLSILIFSPIRRKK